MLQATRSFITTDGFREVRIHRGISRVAEDHEIARRHPQNFKRVPGRSGTPERIRSGGTASIRSTTAPPSRSLGGRESWRVLPDASDCSVSYTPSPTRVRLSAGARAELVAIADRTAGHDGLEVGGLLIGSVTPDRTLVEVLAVTAPGPNAIRERHRYRADAEHDAALAARTRAESNGVAEVGCWHTHPAGAIAVPSGADLHHFAGVRRVAGGDVYAGLVAIPDDSSWTLEAFVVRGGFAARDIAERATLA